jgi:DNA-binding PadR family transcriptional regulator
MSTESADRIELRAKYYRLTPKGGKQVAIETSKWQKLARAIARLLRPA